MLLGAKSSESNSWGVLSILHPLSCFLPVAALVALGDKSCGQILRHEAPCAKGLPGKEARPWGVMGRCRFYPKLCCRPSQQLCVW